MKWLPVFLVFTVLLASEIDYKIVETRFGAIRGRRVDSYGGQSGFVFAGIPLAKKPTGELRFKSPVDPDPWPEILDAFHYRDACLSDPAKTYTKEGKGPVSEDCLYLNLFTSEHCLGKGNCSIIAFVHGGGMKYQSPASFRMEPVINNFANEERNVIVVFLPYRMGAPGTFHLTDQFNTSADTNILFRDILFGLHWIQREIQAFGGNPKRVTLMGHSAGAMATKFAFLSPAFEGLFSQAIIMSSPNPADISTIANMKFSRKIAVNLKCAEEIKEFSDPGRVEKIISCMRSRSTEEILAEQLNIFDNEVEVTYGPWIDGDIFPDYMQQMMKNVKKTKLLIGSVAYEFVNMRYAFNEKGDLLLDRLHEACWTLAYLMNFEKPQEFIEICMAFYRKGNRVIHLEDDRSIHYGVGELANQVAAAGGKAFVYSYNYALAGRAYDKYTYRGGYHPDHTEEYIYVFGLHRNDDFMTPKDYEIERIFTGMIANFVNYGDPSYYGYQWAEWQQEKRNYFDIDFNENLRMPGMKNGFHGDVMDFYDKIVPRLAGSPFPLLEFPKKADIVMFMDVFNGMTTFWSNNTFDKTVEAMTESYWMWREHIEYLERKQGP